MSFASDHLAWQQRVKKEVVKAQHFSDNFVPLPQDSNSPLKGLAERFSCDYVFSDPNGIAKYDLKDTIKTMEIIQKDKAKKLDIYRKSQSLAKETSPSNAIYESTAQAMFNQSKNGNEINKKSHLSPSPMKDEMRMLLSKSNSINAFTSDRYPKAPPFFNQAYLGKSKLDTLSQVSSKLQKSKTLANLAKGYYPPGHPKNQNSSKLPNIKKRFNEDAMSEYSVFSKKSKQGQGIKNGLATHHITSGNFIVSQVV